MSYEDNIQVLVLGESGYDDNLNPIKPTEKWLNLGDCKIHPNEKAQKVTLNDGSDYIYSYLITMYTPDIIPKDGDKVRITKLDESIKDKVMLVKGFVTVSNKLKIWL